MKIEKSTVTKMTITGATNLDPITLYLEDIGLRQGKIIIECYGKSWSAYWGGCGDKGVAAFIRSCNVDYIVNCLDRGIEPTKYSASTAGDVLKKIVIARRRQQDQWRPGARQDWTYDSLTKTEARELWDRIEDTIFYDDPAVNADLICAVVDHDEWWADIPTAPNPDYLYLSRIVAAVQGALALDAQAEPAKSA